MLYNTRVLRLLNLISTCESGHFHTMIRQLYVPLIGAEKKWVRQLSGMFQYLQVAYSVLIWQVKLFRQFNRGLYHFEHHECTFS